MLVRADFHIHSCVSPCASLEMSPAAIAEKAKEKGLDLVALTDHNTALNCPAFKANCDQQGLWSLYGMEVTSSEEAHLVCLFEDVDTALEFSEFVYKYMPDIENKPEVFGDQVYVDENEEILGEVEKYLGNASGLSIDDVREEVFFRNGLFIPAHVDKPVFSIVSQLGFLPDAAYTAIEVFNPVNAKDYAKYPVISDSDAHYLDDVAKKQLYIDVEEKSFAALRDSLQNNRIILK
ncbi:MAG: PHP domain-containing protein [Spirochaetia bacterium]|nr:PHP domain-containing protein [Spirochaetia bacterium]